MTEGMKVGVVVERSPSSSPWADWRWRILRVLPDSPALSAWSELHREGDVVTFFAGEAVVEAHQVETGNYRDNLATGAPLLWVVLRPADAEPGMSLALVTADPAEGEAMTETGDLLVEAVAMPEPVIAWLDAFVRTHHVERAFVKRKREE